MNPDIEISGLGLTRAELRAVARGTIAPDDGGSADERDYPTVRIAADAAEACKQVRDTVEAQWLAKQQDDNPAIYGFNTGVGFLKDKLVSSDRLEEFQTYYIRSHCVGTGEAFAEDTVRAATLVRANSLASAHSGVRLDLLDALLDLLNKEIHPVVPHVGSLGASGDLAPLAHIGAVLTGEPEARVIWKGGTYRVAELPSEAGLRPIRLAPKEAMALTNGTSFMLAGLALVAEDATQLLRLADVVAALSLEAMLGEQGAFDARLQAVRGHPGQELVARNIRRLVSDGEPTDERLRKEYLGKKVATEVALLRRNAVAAGIDPKKLQEFRVSTEHVPRVQDAYSLRCVPQVHGASRDAMNHVTEIVDRELNAVTDNPLLFSTSDGYEAISGGNFHGQPLALAADYACIALAEIGSISERRLYRLLNSNLSYGLPSNLTGGEAGINTGLMISQYTAAALVTENKTLSHPASVDSIPTSGDQEDHVSMGLWAARKAREVLDNSRRVLSIELLAAAQGVDLLGETLGRTFVLGSGTKAAYQQLRDAGVATLRDDRYLETDQNAVYALVRDPSFLENIDRAIVESLE